MRCLDDVRLSLNKLPIWASTFVDHYDTRSGQGENVNGPHAPLITLAHELGHALLNLGEYGAVTFFENQYRSAFGIPLRRTYNGEALWKRIDVDSDTEDYLEWAWHYGK